MFGISEYMLELVYLRCNVEGCDGHLDEIEEWAMTNNLFYSRDQYLKCNKCGKTFKGYEYTIDDNDNIIDFKLI